MVNWQLLGRARALALASTTIGVLVTGVALTPTAAAATTAIFVHGQQVLTISGDAADNSIVVSRDAAGVIEINGGSVDIRGRTPTVADVLRIRVFGAAGNDTITLDEANGPLPPADLFGGDGNDRLTGGSGDDRLAGQAGDDTTLGRAGVDGLAGGDGDDVLVGGDGNDEAFGDGGDDLLVWNPGDDSDLNEGGLGADTVEVNGGNGAESFAVGVNGARVRFDRVDPLPFTLDVGTAERLVLNANGGDDSFSASGDVASLIRLTVNGDDGRDRIAGGNGADLLNGGPGDDFIDGNQGSDIATLGEGDDTFQWDPGDGSDTVDGQAGHDTMLFNGSDVDERFDVSANGGRARFTRNIGTITMDLGGVERIDTNTLDGVDRVTVNDLSGSGVTELDVNEAAADGTSDGRADVVVVNATAGNDAVTVTGSPADGASVAGLAALVTISGTDGADDILTVDALGGDDVIEASGLTGGTVTLVASGGAGDDVITGSAGDDVLFGGEGDDVLTGGPGTDQLDGGPGDNVLIQ